MQRECLIHLSIAIVVGLIGVAHQAFHWKRKGQRVAGLEDEGAGGLFQSSGIAQKLCFVGFFPWEMFATKVTICRGLFVDRVQQIQHLN